MALLCNMLSCCLQKQRSPENYLKSGIAKIPTRARLIKTPLKSLFFQDTTMRLHADQDAFRHDAKYFIVLLNLFCNADLGISMTVAGPMNI